MGHVARACRNLVGGEGARRGSSTAVLSLLSITRNAHCLLSGHSGPYRTSEELGSPCGLADPCGRYFCLRQCSNGCALSAHRSRNCFCARCCRAARSRARVRGLRFFAAYLNGQVRRSCRPQKRGPPSPIRSRRCQPRHTVLSRCPLRSHHFSKSASAQTV